MCVADITDYSGLTWEVGVRTGVCAFLYIRRLKKRKKITEGHAKQADEMKHDEHTGGPELEAIKAYVNTTKAEIDATTPKAKLAGNPEELYDDGIYVIKPELEGSTGTERNRGAYVSKKSELEAVSTPRALIAQQDPAELEAVSLSTRDGASVVAGGS
ncbi:hypothetical protein E0Z10_g471 [Xylaria hypoxylon]|uniref:Uncharacterized protein n=1 Tax=Xylaria hypoxylon TaxID=37992 RepID=A0A4Z0YV60_9PEZI|nr:hypothetical protein E0Z10_g471 [Xylaria hypoxylon]